MAGLRALLLVAGLALTIAVDIGPLLPTPLPDNSNTTTSADETKNQNTKVKYDVTESPRASSSPIPALSMMQEEDIVVTTPKREEAITTKQGRAMNLSSPDLNSMANSINVSSSSDKDAKFVPKTSKIDLSDVSMDNDDMDLDFVTKGDKDKAKGAVGETRILNKPHVHAVEKSFSPLLVPSASSAGDVIEPTCMDSGIVYKLGSRVERDCDEVCTCIGVGQLHCEPRCQGPFFRRGKKIDDPLCSAKVVDDPCCAILVCAADTNKDMCMDGNKTYSMGQSFNVGCQKVCQCETGGKVSCMPRCPALEQREDCVNVQNPNDPCCMLQLCDVSQDVDEPSSSGSSRDPKQTDHNSTSTSDMMGTSTDNIIEKVTKDTENKLGGEQTPFVPLIQEKVEPISSVKLLPNGTVQVILNKNISENSVHLEVSKDGGALWIEVPFKHGILNGLKDGEDYFIRSKETGKKFSVNIPKLKEDNDVISKEDKEGCEHNGKHRAVDEEFHIGCEELCVCEKGGNVHCMPLVCPSHEGLELLDPSCERWGPDPPSFIPSYPHCCPPSMMCVSNGSCRYKETIIPNWSEVPLELSGCGQRCFCESSEVECQAVCAPLPALPPPHLSCEPPARPAPAHPPGDTCCMEWTCVHNGVGGFPPVPGQGVQATGQGAGASDGPGSSREGDLQVVALEAASPTSLRLVFSLPTVMIGLHGRVQLRYTDSSNPDPSSWRLQEFAPPGELLASQQLEFQLGGLKPDTPYRLQAALLLRQLPFVPKSHIYTVRTLPLEEEATMPPIIPIEPNLAVGQVNPTSAQVTWRPFTQDELLYIDGIQLRYREINGKVFSGTPLIHRAVTTFQLEGLKPNTSYEVGIFFIPFLGQHTELQSTNMVRLNTPQQTDIYDWPVTLEVSDVSAWGLALHWSGIPRPAERFVHVIRAVWRAEAARADSSSFSLPARDNPPTTNVTGLTPGTRYRIWLELYLTNGKVKTSNVKDVMTKPGKPAPQEASVQEGKLLDSSAPRRGDYYSSLVTVAVLAALGGVCSLVLLLALLRRHRTASAPICAPSAPIPHPRNNTALPPYDSPTYKLDLQQETMDL